MTRGAGGEGQKLPFLGGIGAETAAAETGKGREEKGRGASGTRAQGQEGTREQRGRGGGRCRVGRLHRPSEQNRNATGETQSSRAGKRRGRKAPVDCTGEKERWGKGTKSSEGLEAGRRAGGRFGGPGAPH